MLYVLVGFTLSVLLVRETHHHARHESALAGELPPADAPSQREVFWRTTLRDRDLSSVTQAGLVNNLNDGMAWGLFPLVFAAAGLGLAEIGWLAGGRGEEVPGYALCVILEPFSDVAGPAMTATSPTSHRPITPCSATARMMSCSTRCWSRPCARSTTWRHDTRA